MSAMEWIKCSDRLPEEDGEYIVYVPKYNGNEYAVVYICCFANNIYDVYGCDSDFEYEYNNEGMPINKPDPVPGWYDDKFEYGEFAGYIQVRGITHWMPLPEPPTDD